MCVELWERRAAFGTYNVTNPGWLATSDVVKIMQKIWVDERVFDFFENDVDFYQSAAKTPRSNTVMEASKVLGVGVHIAPVTDAIGQALNTWSPTASAKNW